MTEHSYWLMNVRLEAGFRYENGAVTGTNTELVHLRIGNGSIHEIVSADAAPPQTDLLQRDANGRLMLPSFRDMHIHLDKTYYGGPWRAPTIPAKGIWTRLEEERELLPRLLPVAEERAKRLLELLIRSGTTRIRAHCNIDPVIGLRNLEATMRAAEAYTDKASVEIVAFPQHGLLRSRSVPLVREALRSGASLVGGVDPATVDGNIEASLHAVMELAVEADADIDLHIHDPGHLGIFTFRRLAALTEEAGWQGRVTISHALALADVSPEEAKEVAQSLALRGIAVTSSVPPGRTIPIPLLREQGVQVSLGDDSITDHWSPFGKGDSLEKAGALAERFGLSDERSLGQALGFITGGVTPLDGAGKRLWPCAGDAADFVLVDASCSAEAVARRADRAVVVFQGKLAAGSLATMK
ncbi:N-isopropylammelide isopropyl amidohydrolase [Paenibacillus konkukensis]|uniref:N-isopropylammelide isopropyl amidohydrolase n=1 Tax=Paenibacillus konkukensis TaxID=2020716 RepID=A0ABY4RNR4_9BACL|nr:amidohydrolase family protein [Paenibacillus konkukensis]UQZ83359.1 N-isopropylammelide isopropyl amidohydrolase [Paenibacillus konkukensis]